MMFFLKINIYNFKEKEGEINWLVNVVTTSDLFASSANCRVIIRLIDHFTEDVLFLLVHATQVQSVRLHQIELLPYNMLNKS